MAVSALATDLYELTMMAGYVEQGRHELVATFELFVRRLPPNRRFLLSAGLESALDLLQMLQFTADDIAWLRTVPAFRSVKESFFSYLEQFRFTGDVWAMPEGTPFFPDEPILQVKAPLAEAQLVETALLSTINYQTAIASKACRVVQAARGRPVIEFGARRTHGLAAAAMIARAAYIAGCSGTSMVEAGRRFGIPLSGTMAHSWVLASDSELDAFSHYMQMFKEQSVLLLDTFDTLAAARKIVAAGLRPSAVRLDSGDLDALSRGVREILDAADMRTTKILLSGDLDEWRIAALIASGAPVDGFGVGTAMATSEDAPALGGVYKLVELDEAGRTRPVMKLSTAKSTWPGRKQVWRTSQNGPAVSDIVALANEPAPSGGVPLIELVMRGGSRYGTQPTLDASRKRARDMLAALPAELLELEGPMRYDVQPSIRLRTAIDLLSGQSSHEPVERRSSFDDDLPDLR